jgi:hypothetical protein
VKQSEKPVSVLQAAREIGRSHTAVQNAITAGRLSRCIVKSKTGKPKILLSLLRDEWATFTDKAGTMDGLQGGRPSQKAKAIHKRPESDAPVRPFREEMPDHTPPEDGENGQMRLDLNDSRAKEAHFDAQLKELKFRQLAAELVEASQVAAEADKLARQIRNMMLGIPERMSSRLAAETDPHKVHRILLDEIHKALTSLPDAAPADAG